MAGKNEISKKKDNLPTTLDFSKYQKDTLNDVDRSERIMPYVVVLQKGSPQCEEGSDEHMPDARPGMLLNTATGDLLKDPVIIPLFRDKCFTERVPDENDPDKYQTVRHDETSDIVVQSLARDKRDDQGWLLTPGGNQICRTIYLNALLLPEANSLDAEPVTLVLRRSKLSTWKEFMDPIARYSASHGIPFHANQRVVKTLRKVYGKNSTYVFDFRFVNEDSTLGLRKNFFGSLVQDEELMGLATESVEFILKGQLRRAEEGTEETEAPIEQAEVEVKKNSEGTPF